MRNSPKGREIQKSFSLLSAKVRIASLPNPLGATCIAVHKIYLLMRENDFLTAFAPPFLSPKFIASLRRRLSIGYHKYRQNADALKMPPLYFALKPNAFFQPVFCQNAFAAHDSFNCRAFPFCFSAPTKLPALHNNAATNYLCPKIPIFAHGYAKPSSLTNCFTAQIFLFITMTNNIILPFRFLFALFLMITAAACQPKYPAPTSKLSKNQMAQLLSDIHLAEAILQTTPTNKKDSVAAVYYTQIFSTNHVDEAVFYENLAYYMRKPDDFNEIYHDVIKNLQKNNVPDANKPNIINLH